MAIAGKQSFLRQPEAFTSATVPQAGNVVNQASLLKQPGALQAAANPQVGNLPNQVSLLKQPGAFKPSAFKADTKPQSRFSQLQPAFPAKKYSAASSVAPKGSPAGMTVNMGPVGYPTAAGAEFTTAYSLAFKS